MNSEQVEKIANAVLYEGYILYPYRKSAVKNQQRWNFGTLYPQAYCQAHGGQEAFRTQTECLILGHGRTQVEVAVRFLHWLQRDVCELTPTKDYRVVEALALNGQLLQTWQEAVERSVTVPSFELNAILSQPRTIAFDFGATCETEPLHDSRRQVGAIVRTQQLVQGSVEVSAECLDEREGLFKLRASTSNLTSLDDANRSRRDEALARALVSAHTILSVREGEFVSLLDPPEQFRAAAAACQNTGVFPVLVGNEGERHSMLSSPIILYDYPQVAPESAGDFFDGTEMDEMLTLRVLTLTDEEKREMRSADDRARQILERTELLPDEQLMKVHGAVRGFRRVTEKQS